MFVQFNSYVKLTCETDVKGTSLTWEHSITGTTPFVPVVSSPFISVTNGRNGELLLELTKSRMSSSGVYRCRGPSVVSSVGMHVVGGLISRLYGTYQCILKVGPDEAGALEVKLAIPPLVKNSKSYVYLYPGEKFVHTCEILAQPTIKSSVLWARNKIPLKSDKTASSTKHLQRIRWDSVTLPNDRIVIDAVELSDRAIYSCFVYNDMGNSTGAVYLQVISE
ncbi:uncharacterized protein DEA37_0010236 [Paragonimus westermani]|uniref:Ig-like domain-containing protein n=1 Tax=Paragonimus westermani TaxID=34504 RepID=A0A5J4NMR6_9TREM|nr:uncharacterized protein DEA37_0010236 [Paragonimus westermani]